MLTRWYRVERETTALTKLAHTGFLPKLILIEYSHGYPALPKGPLVITEWLEGKTLSHNYVASLPKEEYSALRKKIEEAYDSFRPNLVTHDDARFENWMLVGEKIFVVDWENSREVKTPYFREEEEVLRDLRRCWRERKLFGGFRIGDFASRMALHRCIDLEKLFKFDIWRHTPEPKTNKFT